ncbi:MAG: hypothetical protein MUC92_12065, partial [Fimbriimonadaceae bacterium]|nr:hypothetical protein [Fimbriimonadaceae bacterium]
MNQVMKCVVATTIVGVTVAAGLLGSAMRARVDTGNLVAGTSAMTPPVLASKTNMIPGRESEAFYNVAQVLMREYVEPIALDEKMAIGSVKGMIGSLADP